MKAEQGAWPKRGKEAVDALEYLARSHELLHLLGEVAFDDVESLKHAFGYPYVALIDQVLCNCRQIFC